jgi:hypothetical protein
MRVELLVLIAIVLLVLIVSDSSTSYTIDNVQFESAGSYNDGYPATLTWTSESRGPFTITATAGNTQCTTGTFTQSGCWQSFDSPTNSGNNWTASGKTYNSLGGDVEFVISAPDASNGNVVAAVSCIHEECLIKTLLGPKKAKDVMEGDLLAQLDGTFRNVRSVKTSYNSEALYRSENAVVTKWHPVRFPDETKYVVAHLHPLLEEVFLPPSVVYHFELENQTDDILFEDDILIAESWNNLEHGVEVQRFKQEHGQ